MSKFHLTTETILQGDFEIQSLNLILIFQVNCPGCFIYALPLAAKLHQKHGAYLNILGLSTAFEDFELNTATNTQKLLDKGEMIGVTQQYFQKSGTLRYATPLEFPVAFDRETFALNRLQGTPSWVLFDADYNVLSGWFGHKPEAEVDAVLRRFIEKSLSNVTRQKSSSTAMVTPFISLLSGECFEEVTEATA